MKLNEVATPSKGTYAGVKFTPETVEALAAFCKEHNIPNAINADELHSTVLYSRKHCPDYSPIETYDPPCIGKFDAWNVWNTSPTEGDSTKCLVLKMECPDLEKRHHELMDEHGATFDYDKYQPHVTLSYNIGDDFDVDSLPPFEGDVSIAGEYMEELDLDKAKKYGK